METSQIKIAVDSNIIYRLCILNKLIDENSIDKEMLLNVCNGSIDRNYIKATYAESVENLPPLFKNEFFCQTNKYGRYYNIKNYYELLQWIKQGHIKVYVTSTVFNETKHLIKKNELKDYIVALKVKEEDLESFSDLLKDLVNSYISEGLQEKHAIKMAEASLFGMIFLTGAERYYLHKDLNAEDYAIKDKICEVNKKFNLHFISSAGLLTLPEPIGVVKFKRRVHFYLTNGYFQKSLYIQKSNLNEEGDSFELKGFHK